MAGALAILTTTSNLVSKLLGLLPTPWEDARPNWRAYYKAGPAPPWSADTGAHVSWHGIDSRAWDEVAPDVGLTRWATKCGAAMNLELPDVAEALRGKSGVVVAATRVFHFHRLLGAPITLAAAAEKALMVHYDAEYVTDPARATARVVAEMPEPAEETRPLLCALGRACARTLVAPEALRQRESHQAPTPSASDRKTQ